MSGELQLDLFGVPGTPPPPGRGARAGRPRVPDRPCAQCGLSFTPGRRERYRYCSKLCRETAIMQRQLAARRLVQEAKTCHIVTCSNTFYGRGKYCSEACLLTAAARPDLKRGSRLETIRCAWCGQPAANQPATRRYQRTARTIWPYVCATCWAPVIGVRRQLRAHRVPVEAVRDLVKDPACRICGINVLELAGPNAIRGQGVPAAGRARPLLAIDHDHRCCPGSYSCGGCFRGFLCLRCNLMVGHGADDPARLRAGARYLAGDDEAAG
jgi:hypothetical protein